MAWKWNGYILLEIYCYCFLEEQPQGWVSDLSTEKLRELSFQVRRNSQLDNTCINRWLKTKLSIPSSHHPTIQLIIIPSSKVPAEAFAGESSKSTMPQVRPLAEKRNMILHQKKLLQQPWTTLDVSNLLSIPSSHHPTLQLPIMPSSMKQHP